MSKIIVNTTLVLPVRDKDGKFVPGQTKDVPPGVYLSKGFPVESADLADLQKSGHVVPLKDDPKEA